MTRYIIVIFCLYLSLSKIQAQNTLNSLVTLGAISGMKEEQKILSKKYYFGNLQTKDNQAFEAYFKEVEGGSLVCSLDSSRQDTVAILAWKDVQKASIDNSNFVSLKNYEKDKDVWRVVFIHEKFELYDKKLDILNDNFSYDTMVIKYKPDNTYELVIDFWTGSTKRKLIRLLNKALNKEISYKTFKNKEALMKAILNRNSVIFK